MAETQKGSALGGCLSLVVLLMIGSCVFGGKADDVTTSSTPKAADLPSPIAKEANPTNPPKKALAQNDEEPATPELADAQRILLSALKSLNYPCAKITYVTQMRDDEPQYGVTCRKHRIGPSEVHYLIDTSTGLVSRLKE